TGHRENPDRIIALGCASFFIWFSSFSLSCDLQTPRFYRDVDCWLSPQPAVTSFYSPRHQTDIAWTSSLSPKACRKKRHHFLLPQVSNHARRRGGRYRSYLG